jgi:hypothetical protein
MRQEQAMTRLEEIEKRLGEATSGPWFAYDWPDFPRRDEAKGCVRIESKYTITAFCFSGKPNNDALFIANAPADIRYLLDEVAQLTKALEEK